MPRPPNQIEFDMKLIEQQVLWGHKYKKICEHHKGLTPYLLRKIIKEHGILRKYDGTDSKLIQFLSKLMASEKQTWGFNFVNTYFRERRIYIPEKKLKQCMRELDPELSEKRYALNVTRISQTYTAGPMHMWCVDAYCKLSKFGIWGYLHMDFASGFCLDASVMKNMRPHSVWKSYFRALKVSRGISPWTIRMDQGTETVFMKVHHSYRMGFGAIKIGKSTHNVGVERVHRETFEKAGWWILQQLQCLVSKNLLDQNNYIHLFSVWEIYGQRYQQNLNEWREAHNKKKRRSQKRRNKPGGIAHEEFETFFGENRVTDNLWNEYKKTKWTYTDWKFDQYRENCKLLLKNKKNLMNLSDNTSVIPIENPYVLEQMKRGKEIINLHNFVCDEDGWYDLNSKNYPNYQPNRNVVGDPLNERGGKVRDCIIKLMMMELNQNKQYKDDYLLMMKYLFHRITTEELKILYNKEEAIYEPSTINIRRKITNYIFQILNQQTNFRFSQ